MVWSRGAFCRFLASVGRDLETLLLAEVRQDDTNLVRHLRNVAPMSAPTLIRSACTNREQQALLHACLFEETATSPSQKALEDDILRWQKKRGMGIYLSDKDHDCLTNM